MAYTPVELIALIVAVGILVKLVLFLAVGGKKWSSLVEKVYGGRTGLLAVVYLILALVVLKYLLLELSIVQIVAAMAFCALLMGVAFAAFGKDTVAFSKRVLRRPLPGWVWVSSLIWLVLAVWVLRVLVF
tara:strand:- start:1344 stop:1733 length:390 start_codon:yes stop_codon:yes gene_type:complete